MADSVDIEVGRYALRTFDLTQGKLGSLYQSHFWEGGVAIATCLKHSAGKIAKWCDGILLEESHSVLDPQCTCGLYGTLSMEQLVKDYGKRVGHGGIAVIAAEGPTVIGPRGLRTTAARVVAFYPPTPDPGVYDRECPQARRFEDLNEMLKAYGFAEFPLVDWFTQSVEMSQLMVAALRNHLRLFPQDRDQLIAKFGISWLPVAVPVPPLVKAPSGVAVPTMVLPIGRRNGKTIEIKGATEAGLNAVKKVLGDL